MNVETKSGTERFIYEYHAYDHQKAFYESRLTYRLLGGAAGPGKTSSYRRPHAELQSVQFAGCAASSYPHFAAHASQARIHRHYSFSRENPQGTLSRIQRAEAHRNLAEWINNPIRLDAIRARRMGLARPVVQDCLRRTYRVHISSVAEHLRLESVSRFATKHQGRCDQPYRHRSTMGGICS
jgi:hypothetical protein